MGEIVNWIFWSIGIVASAIGLFIGVSWFIFWITEIVTEARRQKTVIADRAAEARRWFSGFKDLDIIWDYIYGETHGISQVRDAYARARNTNVYGNELVPMKQGKTYTRPPLEPPDA